MENLFINEQEYSERSDKVLEDIKAIENDQEVKIQSLENDKGIFLIKSYISFY
jgi:hypothetical protein